MRALVRSASPAPLATFGEVAEPELSVVVVTYGTGLVLERCLAGLAASLESDGLAAEVIVVDNPHPERGTWSGDRVCLATRGVLVARAGRNLGFGGGNDAGIRVGRAPLLCLLNPDTVVAPGQLRRLVEVARSRPSAIVAPGFVNPDGSLQELGQRLLADATTVPVLERDGPIDYASAACWVLHRDVYEGLGGFDPVFHPAYYEDVDFVLRARRSGHELVVVPDVLVVHEQRGSTTAAPSVLPDVSRQRAAFVERWPDVLRGRAPGPGT